MKNKLTKIMGVAFALVVIASMMLFAIPAAAGPFPDALSATSNVWTSYTPTAGAPGGWFFSPNISVIGPTAEAINGDLFAYVGFNGTFSLPDEDATDDELTFTFGPNAVANFFIDTGSATYTVGGGGSMSGYTFTADADGSTLAINADSDYTTGTWTLLECCCATAAVTANGGSNGTPTYTQATRDLFKSVDGGRIWSVSTHPGKYAGGPIVDIAVSTLSEDILYVTDGNYAYKSVNGGTSFSIVAEDSLETMLLGICGPAVHITGCPITSIDVGYNASDNPYVFIGVRGTYVNATPVNLLYPSVLYINEAGYPSEWLDLGLYCFHASGATPGGYTPLSIGVAPNFATSKKIYVTVTDTAASPDTNNHTYIISSVGITCSWSEVSQLFWNCNAANNFRSFHATRFAFPDDYADTGAMFIGVADSGNGGDVYRVDDAPGSIALDLNVGGFTSGCLGGDTDICSLDIKGGTDDGSLIAGAWWNNQVYYSSDGGFNWDDSDKDPTGVDRTYVLWYEETALAATRFCDAAFSMSCGDEVGKYFNQISLIHTDIDNVVDMSFSPGYGDSSSTMYIVTKCFDPCLSGSWSNSTSVLRYDGTYWERVYSEISHEYRIMIEWVEVSPDFDTTNCLYIANSLFQMLRSQDAGCSWRTLSYPCAPLPHISAWIVVDEETVLAAGAGSDAGTIFKTDRHGSRPWDEIGVLDANNAPACDGVDFDLSPSIATDESILFGDECGSVFLSADLGASWAELSEPGPFGSFSDAPAYVVFDPGYGTAGDPGETTVYAAAGSDIGRFAVGVPDWLYLSDAAGDCVPCTLYYATGIAAAGDTTLYVSDSGYEFRDQSSSTVTGTMGLSYIHDTGTVNCDFDVPATYLHPIPSTGPFIDGEPLTIVNYNLECEPEACIQGELLVQGIISGAYGWVYFMGPSDLDEPCDECTVTGGAVMILYSSLVAHIPYVYADYPTGVWRTVNPLDPIDEVSGFNAVEFEFLDDPSSLEGDTTLAHPPIFPNGETYSDDLWLTAGSNVLWALDLGNFDYIWTWDDPLATQVVQVSPANGAALVTPASVTLEWDALDGGFLFEVNLYSYCPACPNQKTLDATYYTGDTCLPLVGLDAGNTYYWKVRVACGSPFVSKWSDLWSFDTALTSVPYLCSPICGASGVIINTNFSWDEVPGAASYDIQVATDEGFTSLIVDASATVNAYVPATALDYSTTYYWRVRAVGANADSAWSVCIFTTADEPAAPVEPTAPVEITQTEITPMWIWVIIGIGGALTIAVIILIVTTRRVP